MRLLTRRTGSRNKDSAAPFAELAALVNLYNLAGIILETLCFSIFDISTRISAPCSEHGLRQGLDSSVLPTPGGA